MASSSSLSSSCTISPSASSSSIWSMVLSFFWSIFKFIMRIVSGKCELERICSNKSDVNFQITKQFEQCFANSKQLSSLLEENTNKQENTTFNYLSTKYTDVDEVFGKIIKIKKKSFVDEHSRKVCKTCLRHMINLNQSIVHLDSLARTPFELSNQKHKDMLLQFWSILKPNQQLELLEDREELTSRDWKHVGFQGLHPQTDFRGMGILGLQNLLEFAKTHTRDAQNILMDCEEESIWYPFAISGINISGILVDYIRSHHITNIFYTLNFEMDTAFHQQKTESILQELYNYVFINFHDYYIKNNGNVMKFNTLLQSFLRQPSVNHHLCNWKFSEYPPSNPNNYC